MDSVDDIIGLWPSMADLGRDLGLPYPTVAAWKQRGSIPVTYWRELVRAAQQRGYHEVTADLLVEAHDQTGGGPSLAGLAEEPPSIGTERQLPAETHQGSGQFSRWKPLRRTHFGTIEEIVEHVRALRSEWDRR